MRKLLTSAALALGVLSAGSALACPSDSKIGLAAGAVAIGYTGWNTTMGVSEVGAPIGIVAFGLYNNYCTTGSMFKAAPVTFVETTPGAGYAVRAADVSNGLTSRFAAKVTLVGDEERAQRVAEYMQAIGAQVEVAAAR